jgi:hypothetical protein
VFPAISVLALLIASLACNLQSTAQPGEAPVTEAAAPTNPPVATDTAAPPPTLEPTDTPVPTDTREATDTLEPTAAPATDTPEPAEAAAAAAELVPYEEPNGVFSIDVPADFERSQEAEEEVEGAYAFTGPAENAALFVLFEVIQDRGVSDLEWGLFTRMMGPAVLESYGEQFGVGFEELERREGEAGEHTLYLEGQSVEEDLHIAVQLEEAEGVLAILAYAVSNNEWPQREAQIVESQESFTWSAEAAREMRGAAAEPSPPTPTQQ